MRKAGSSRKEREVSIVLSSVLALVFTIAIAWHALKGNWPSAMLMACAFFALAHALIAELGLGRVRLGLVFRAAMLAFIIAAAII